MERGREFLFPLCAGHRASHRQATAFRLRRAEHEQTRFAQTSSCVISPSGSRRWQRDGRHGRFGDEPFGLAIIRCSGRRPHPGPPQTRHIASESGEGECPNTCFGFADHPMLCRTSPPLPSPDTAHCIRFRRGRVFSALRGGTVPRFLLSEGDRLCMLSVGLGFGAEFVPISQRHPDIEQVGDLRIEGTGTPATTREPAVLLERPQPTWLGIPHDCGLLAVPKRSQI